MTLAADPVGLGAASGAAAPWWPVEDRAAQAGRLAARLQGLIRAQRSWTAELADVLAEAERSQAFALDGHRTLIGWCRALSSCSTAQAGRWRRIARLCAAVPEVHTALAEGQVGVEHVQELARAYANPRVRRFFPEYIDALLHDAARSPLEVFRVTVLQWERLLDEDGAEPNADRAHRNRYARFDFDETSTRLAAAFGNVDGAEMAEILARYCDAEFRADCDAARQRWGEDGYLGHLPRTARQRAADALRQLFLDAARSRSEGTTPDPLLNITVDLATFEEIVNDLAADLADDDLTDDDLDLGLDLDDLDFTVQRLFDDDATDTGATDPAGAGDVDDADSTAPNGRRDRVDHPASPPAAGETDGAHDQVRDAAGDEAEGDDRTDTPDDGDGDDDDVGARHGAGSPAGARAGPRAEARQQARAGPVRGSPPLRPVARSPEPRWWRCESQHGAPVPRRAVIEAMLLGHVRRVVVDAAGVAVDVGRRRRLFTGVQREMVMRIARWCTFAGCNVPARHCQADHTLDHRFGGSTATSNGGPLCGHHNRLKNQGYTVWLDPDGRWHTYRPDGTEITGS